jgi:hypothetical protein
MGKPDAVESQQQQPDTEQDDRQAIARALGKVLRLARHAADLNLTCGPGDALGRSLTDLRIAIDSAVRCCKQAGGDHG